MKLLFLALATVSLCGCASFEHISKPPKFSDAGVNLHASSSAAASTDGWVDTAQMASSHGAAIASLWRSGPESLFGDRRARKVGDIVTVLVEIDDEAEIKNKTGRTRSGSDTVAAPALLGAGLLAEKVLPGGAGLDPAVEASSKASSSGEGTIKRNEKITLKVAATVTSILPNGHLVVMGGQEVRVNFELRELFVSGVIRTEDISRSNVITYEKIADARISYGGRGQISDMQRARYGQQILDRVSPF